MLQAGDRVPDFSLETGDGGRVASDALRGQRYVLYFYPKDDTPGCTKEACGFRDARARFDALGVRVFGVSADSAAAHARFASRHALNFPLLADPERRLIEGVGAWVEKSLYGRRYMGIARVTFVVGPDGRVEKVFPKVTPAEHADAVLAYLSGSEEVKARPAKAASPKPAAKPSAAKHPAATKPAAKPTTKNTARPAAKQAARARRAKAARRR
jgi:peroxiredoxin Q/BCP